MIKICSLSSDTEFKKILKQKKIHTDLFIIYFGKTFSNPHKNEINMSFIIKKKIGNAVKRNKIKRKLKSAVLKNMNIINRKFVYLIFAKKKTFEQKFSILSDQMYRTLDEINKLKK